MHDAMLLTLYAHRNNPIFLPRFSSSFPSSFPSSAAAALSHRAAVVDPPSVIYFHLFRPSYPVLISFGLVAPCYGAACGPPSTCFITARNDSSSPRRAREILCSTPLTGKSKITRSWIKKQVYLKMTRDLGRRITVVRSSVNRVFFSLCKKNVRVSRETRASYYHNPRGK